MPDEHNPVDTLAEVFAAIVVLHGVEGLSKICGTALEFRAKHPVETPDRKSAHNTETVSEYAISLARYMHDQFYPEVTNWVPSEDTYGVLSQIDNMLTDLTRIRL